MFKGKKYKVSERRYKQVMDEVKDRVEYVAVARINGWLERLAHRKQSNYPYRRFRSSTNF